MSRALSRRAMFAAVPALTVPVPAGAVTSPASPDAELLALAAAWRAEMATFDDLGDAYDEAEPGEEEDRLGHLREEAAKRVDRAENRMAVLPARTLAGLQAKAEVALRYLDPPGELTLGLFRDLIRGVRA